MEVEQAEAHFKSKLSPLISKQASDNLDNTIRVWHLGDMISSDGNI